MAVLILLAYGLFYFPVPHFASGFSIDWGPASEDLIRQMREGHFQNLQDEFMVLYRNKRDEENVKSAWDEKQDSIKTLKELRANRGDHSESEEGYDSYKRKWFSKWSTGAIERRLQSLKIDSRRFDFPLALPLPGRPNPYKEGLFKDLTDAVGFL